MSTASYSELLSKAKPQIIDDERSHRRALSTIDALMNRPRLSTAEEKLLDLLAKLVNDYEEHIYPTPKVSPARMLSHLIDARGVSQAEVARETGISRSTISEVNRGKRKLSVENAYRLAEYFHVQPMLFLER
ncbi:helix-turn-helix domain-containing protein [Bythopirellula goksoeyrii]|uniref:Antitoxin HigA n=1 Tax=Bythopirellula goksoeyrii TaxID=1400387 RepID=A0A5B9QI32_9BACT|nr:helix-turn-helix domain-containing protein [Bythopirellula goksoeyrii]QEG37332.1 Antitoxin HigA [Bythopirellula goksoeyrii]